MARGNLNNDYWLAVILKLPLAMGVWELGPNHLLWILLASPLFSIANKVSLTNFTNLGLPLAIPNP
jgi:hypothetical protein